MMRLVPRQHLTSYVHAENKNDIMFVADDQTGYGYFKNFGKTQHQGIETSIDRKVSNGLRVGANYTYLDVTYQSYETVNGAGNSTNSEGNGLKGSINIKLDNKIPLLPEHSFKTYIDYQFIPE